VSTRRPTPPTEYERAKLRLEAWKAIEGWGTKEPDGSHRNYSWEERKSKAAELARWALNLP
jgi:hypothetical protein